MKHIKLFEAFGTPESNEVMLGFYGEGGHGSHPGVVTQEFLDGLNSLGDDNYKTFVVTNIEGSLPEAIVCIYNDMDGEWFIKGVSGSLASKIMNLIGGDHIAMGPDYDGDLTLINQISNMVDYRESDESETTLISVIPNPTINTIYWSDAPELEQTYWQPPYKAIPAEDLLDPDFIGGSNI